MPSFSGLLDDYGFKAPATLGMAIHILVKNYRQTDSNTMAVSSAVFFLINQDITGQADAHASFSNIADKILPVTFI